MVEAASVGALVTLMDLVKVCALEAVGRRLRGSVVSEPLGVEVFRDTSEDAPQTDMGSGGGDHRASTSRLDETV